MREAGHFPWPDSFLSGLSHRGRSEPDGVGRKLALVVELAGAKRILPLRLRIWRSIAHLAEFGHTRGQIMAGGHVVDDHLQRQLLARRTFLGALFSSSRAAPSRRARAMGGVVLAVGQASALALPPTTRSPLIVMGCNVSATLTASSTSHVATGTDALRRIDAGLPFAVGVLDVQAVDGMNDGVANGGNNSALAKKSRFSPWWERSAQTGRCRSISLRPSAAQRTHCLVLSRDRPCR